MMLFGKANCLLLDEPTNHLDVWSRMTLEQALRRYDGTLIVVSHDRHFVDAVTSKVLEIRDGDVHFYPGKYSDYLRRLENETGGQRASAETARGEPRRAGSSPSPKTSDGGLLSQIQAVEPRPGHRKTREQRRQEAEERNRRGKTLQPLQRRVRKLEEKIQLHEIRVNAINTELTVPEIYDTPERVTALMKERKSITEEVEKLTAEWGECQGEIEALTRR
jgi:ATP-binding cassette subfamily F protein 3